VTASILLRKGKLSTSLSKHLQEYYKKTDICPEYVLIKWQQWENDPEININLVKKEKETIGWLIYSPNRSTIEEILLKKEWRGRGLEPEVIDVLVKRETLVAAEICREDEDKYRWMVEYGFRPTGSFTIGEISGIKLDLSTSVLIDKLNKFKTTRAYRKKEQVAIERIPETQSDIEIRLGLANLLDKLGGLEKFVKPG